MDAYIHNSLQPGERLIHMSHPHWIVFVPSLASLILPIGLIFVFNSEVYASVKPYMFAGLLFMSSVQFFRAWVYYVSTELGVTDRRIIGKLGLFSRHVVELDLDRIDAVTVQQPFLIGMLLNYGTVTIKGLSGTPIPIHTISNPMAFRNARPTRSAQAAPSNF